jgi:hypothetical protein
MLRCNTYLIRIEWQKIPRYIAEDFEIDVGDLIPEFLVTDTVCFGLLDQLPVADCLILFATV